MAFRDQPPPAGSLARRITVKREVHFGYVGRLVEEKGLPLLLEAVREIKAQGVRHRLSLLGTAPPAYSSSSRPRPRA